MAFLDWNFRRERYEKSFVKSITTGIKVIPVKWPDIIKAIMDILNTTERVHGSETFFK